MHSNYCFRSENELLPRPEIDLEYLRNIGLERHVDAWRALYKPQEV
jgi:hypothetical protein